MTRSLVALAVALSILQAAAAPRTGAVAIHSAGAVDVRRGRLIPDAVVLVHGDRITSIGSRAAVQVPADATRIDLGNATLLPGLIDAHVHLTLAGAAAANARQTLDAGFTTVQDLGAVDYATLALRDAIAAGQISGPRVVASGPWLGIAKGSATSAGSASAAPRRSVHGCARTSNEGRI